MRTLGTAVAALAVFVATAAAACGSSTPTPAPSHVQTPTPKPTPTPVPTPDNESVSVVTTGVGAWQLVAIPVAILKNNAANHGAAAVVVHFVTHSSGGAALGTLDSEAVNLAPGETLPVAADCTDGCNGAASTDVTVNVGSWTTSTGPFFTTTSGAYQCGTGACGGGRGQGSVSGPLTVSRLAADSSIVVFAVCTSAGGAVMGAGVTQTIWPGGSSAPVRVPVIVNSDPSACQLGASAGW
ncbi:MAG: hypothetical protein JOZ75_00530 [Candidatus Dormibacteraeota bacterium]|nr:hypothetical protein [Candidatus Dormibacteraeota bacterium]